MCDMNPLHRYFSTMLHHREWLQQLAEEKKTDKESIDKEAEWVHQLNQLTSIKTSLGKGHPFYGGLDPFWNASLIEDYTSKERIDLRVTPAFSGVALDNVRDTCKHSPPTLCVGNILHSAEAAMAQFRLVARSVSTEFQDIADENDFARKIEKEWNLDVNRDRIYGTLKREVKPSTGKGDKDRFVDFCIYLSEVEGSGYPTDRKARDVKRKFVVLVELKFFKAIDVKNRVLVNTDKFMGSFSSNIANQIVSYVKTMAKRDPNDITCIPIAIMLVYNKFRKESHTNPSMNEVHCAYWSGMKCVLSQWGNGSHTVDEIQKSDDNQNPILFKRIKNGGVKIRRGPSSAQDNLDWTWDRADEITGKRLDDSEIIANAKKKRDSAYDRMSDEVMRELHQNRPGSNDESQQSVRSSDPPSGQSRSGKRVMEGGDGEDDDDVDDDDDDDDGDAALVNPKNTTKKRAKTAQDRKSAAEKQARHKADERKRDDEDVTRKRKERDGHNMEREQRALRRFHPPQGGNNESAMDVSVGCLDAESGHVLTDDERKRKELERQRLLKENSDRKAKPHAKSNPKNHAQKVHGNGKHYGFDASEMHGALADDAKIIWGCPRQPQWRIEDRHIPRKKELPGLVYRYITPDTRLTNYWVLVKYGVENMWYLGNIHKTEMHWHGATIHIYHPGIKCLEGGHVELHVSCDAVGDDEEFECTANDEGQFTITSKWGKDQLEMQSEYYDAPGLMILLTPFALRYNNASFLSSLIENQKSSFDKQMQQLEKLGSSLEDPTSLARTRGGGQAPTDSVLEQECYNGNVQLVADYEKKVVDLNKQVEQAAAALTTMTQLRDTAVNVTKKNMDSMAAVDLDAMTKQKNAAVAELAMYVNTSRTESEEQVKKSAVDLVAMTKQMEEAVANLNEKNIASNVARQEQQAANAACTTDNEAHCTSLELKLKLSKDTNDDLQEAMNSQKNVDTGKMNAQIEKYQIIDKRLKDEYEKTRQLYQEMWTDKLTWRHSQSRFKSSTQNFHLQLKAMKTERDDAIMKERHLRSRFDGMVKRKNEESLKKVNSGEEVNGSSSDSDDDATTDRSDDDAEKSPILCTKSGTKSRGKLDQGQRLHGKRIPGEVSEDSSSDDIIKSTPRNHAKRRVKAVLSSDSSESENSSDTEVYRQYHRTHPSQEEERPAVRFPHETDLNARESPGSMLKRAEGGVDVMYGHAHSSPPPEEDHPDDRKYGTHLTPQKLKELQANNAFEMRNIDKNIVLHPETVKRKEEKENEKKELEDAKNTAVREANMMAAAAKTKVAKEKQEAADTRKKNAAEKSAAKKVVADRKASEKAEKATQKILLDAKNAAEKKRTDDIDEVLSTVVDQHRVSYDDSNKKADERRIKWKNNVHGVPSRTVPESKTREPRIHPPHRRIRDDGSQGFSHQWEEETFKGVDAVHAHTHKLVRRSCGAGQKDDIDDGQNDDTGAGQNDDIDAGQNDDDGVGQNDDNGADAIACPEVKEVRRSKRNVGGKPQ